MNARRPAAIDTRKLLDQISEHWDKEIVPELIEYVKLPAKSPAFDREWAKHGFLDAAVAQAKRWVEAQNIAGLALEVIRLGERTPVLYFDIPATGGLDEEHTVLLYGHLDKQPEMTGWREGTGPWIPVYEDGKLYGRGASDDGYAVFAALAAIKALDQQGIARAHCVGLIETCACVTQFAAGMLYFERSIRVSVLPESICACEMIGASSPGRVCVSNETARKESLSPTYAHLSSAQVDFPAWLAASVSFTIRKTRPKRSIT